MYNFFSPSVWQPATRKKKDAKVFKKCEEQSPFLIISLSSSPSFFPLSPLLLSPFVAAQPTPTTSHAYILSSTTSGHCKPSIVASPTTPPIHSLSLSFQLATCTKIVYQIEYFFVHAKRKFFRKVRLTFIPNSLFFMLQTNSQILEWLEAPTQVLCPNSLPPAKFKTPLQKFFFERLRWMLVD